MSSIHDGYVSLGDGQREHVAIAERALGKSLPLKAVVHHFNEDRADNRNRNLVICQDQAYHGLLHALERVRRAGGRPFLDAICSACRLVKPVTEFTRSSCRGRKVRAHECRSCAARLQAEVRARRKSAVRTVQIRVREGERLGITWACIDGSTFYQVATIPPKATRVARTAIVEAA